MVKFIRSVIILSIAATLTGCLSTEYHLYTRSIAKSDSWQIREIPKELFNGTYQRLNTYEGTPAGTVTFNTNRCAGLDLISDLDPNASCRSSDDSDVIKMHKIVRVNDRLFVEANVKTGLFSSRFALFELVMTKDKFVLIQMVYDKDKLIESGLNFSRSQSGDDLYFEVQNRAGQTLRLIETMKHVSKYNSIHFKPVSGLADNALRYLLKDVRAQEFPFVNEKKSCDQTVLTVNGSGKPYSPVKNDVFL